jgi:uncharacterized Zn-binding protein involved in type VI secretion
MGKPAARMGDTANTCNDPSDMPVGKVIAKPGTVMINKMPAAKQGDQIVGVDTHIIMIPAPPGPPVPTPLPHPFNGIINTACSTSVKIMGMPAATVDSIANNTPPHIPQGGPFQKPPMNQGKIIMGSTNVMIANGGGGGGSGGGGAEAKVEVTSQAAEVKEGHYLDVKFTDKGGKPIMGVAYQTKDPDSKTSDGPLTGEIKRQGVKEGSHEIALKGITKAAWSAKESREGEEVKLQVETVGIADGVKAKFEIWERDIKKADRLISTIKDIDLKGGKAEADWKYEITDEEFERWKADRGRGYSLPQYYYIIEVDGLRQKSGNLGYKSWIEIELTDEEGKSVGNAEYKLYLSTGEIRSGKLDGNGYKKEKNIPPRGCRLEFPGSGKTQIIE